MKFVPKGPIDIKSGFAQVVTQFTDAYMRHPLRWDILIPSWIE